MKTFTCSTAILFLSIIKTLLCLGNENNLRISFLNRKRENLKRHNRIRLLEKYITNYTLYLDDIPHTLIHRNSTKWSAINKIENEFINIIKMNGVNYTYKRDFHWRTWREVFYPEGKKLLCYECRNGMNETSNHKNCEGSSYWVIQEKPPCPFEFFSLDKENLICAFNYKNFDDLTKPCPVMVNLNDIAAFCDNPIKTHWRITRVYKAGEFEHKFPILCIEQDYCEIMTLYQINDESIVFRIVNSTNNILYSKIMKSNVSYGCIEDCGSIDPDTLVVKITQKPLVVNLLNLKSHKKKRENYDYRSIEVYKRHIDTKDKNKSQVNAIIAKKHKHKPSFEEPDNTRNNLKINVFTNNREKTKTSQYLIESPIQEFGINNVESRCNRLIENFMGS